MKGQRLFVRFAQPGDSSEISRFYEKEKTHDPALEIPTFDGSDFSEGLIGKLVGDLVAHVRFSRAGEIVRLEHIHVARLLRHKRIGRLMISELARMTGRVGATRIDAPASCDAASFLRATGFEEATEDALLTMTIKLEEDQ